MNKLILFKHPVSYAKLKDALEDVIENFIDSSDLDYKNQAYWLKYFHRILMGKALTYRDKVNDLDNQIYVQRTFDTGYDGKICFYDGVQTKGPVTLTDETMINGICVVAPKKLFSFFCKYNKSLYKVLIKMGNFIKNSIEKNDNRWFNRAPSFLGALLYLKKLTPFKVSFFTLQIPLRPSTFSLS